MKETPDEELLVIHENALEKDCQALPRRTFQWGQKLAQARRRVKEVKNSLKLIFAEIAMDIRNNHLDYGLEKVTEGGIEQTVLLQPSYQSLQSRLVEAEFEEDVLDAFLKSLQDHKKELENMVQLHGQMYWSKPRQDQGQTEQHRRAAMDQTTDVKPTRRKK